MDIRMPIRMLNRLIAQSASLVHIPPGPENRDLSRISYPERQNVKEAQAIKKTADWRDQPRHLSSICSPILPTPRL